MTAVSRAIASKPYKGAESYQAEDGELFFGREREAEQIVAMVVSRRLSVLHAPSGAGKTSLLNTRLIPELERRGFLPVRVLPQNHPLEAIRVSLLEYLLPPPEAEALAVRQAIAELASSDSERLEPGLTLRQLRERRDALPARRTAKRALVAPVEGCAAPPALALGELGAVLPWFRRWLRGSVAAAAFEVHLRAISERAAARHLGLCTLDEDFPAQRLLALFADPELVADYEVLFESLYPPLPGLLPFLDNLHLGYGQYGDSSGLVIVLDQFEELFTRFVGAEPGVRGDQRPDLDRPGEDRKLELFRELAALRRREQGAAAGPPAWPVRILVSMRNEYLANLDELSREDPDFKFDERYHLYFLERENAAAAVREPAIRFGYRYGQACYDEIMKELTQEDGRVQPAHVQIVCEKLWEESGADLARHHALPAGGDGALPEIPYDTYLEKLRGAQGILQSYLDDVLARLEKEFLSRQAEAREAGDGWLADLSATDIRLEALELLEPLKTGAGTRNIVARSELVSQPFRRSDLRSWLLDRLNDHRIVRVEKRLKGLFVEITHEFLIRPIQDRLLNEIKHDSSIPEPRRLAQFRDAFARLRSAIDEEVRRSDRTPLTARDLEHLAAHAARLDLDYLGAERVLRFAILEDQSGGTLSRWVDRLRATAEPTLKTIFERGRPMALSIDELELVNANRDDPRLDRDQLEVVLESALLRFDPTLRHRDVTYWARRLRDHGTQR